MNRHNFKSALITTIAVLGFLSLGIFVVLPYWTYFRLLGASESGERISDFRELASAGPIGKSLSREYAINYFRKNRSFSGAYLEIAPFRGFKLSYIVDCLGQPTTIQGNAYHWVLDDHPVDEYHRITEYIVTVDGSTIISEKCNVYITK